MTRSTLEWYDLLARGLVWAAGIVLLLSLIGAVVIAGSDSALPFAEEAERQGRGVAALAALGGGLTSAGILAGIGAIVRVLAADRLAKLPDAPEDAREDGDPPPPPPGRERAEGRRKARVKPEESDQT